MEHGAVWITYSPDLVDSDLKVLEQLTSSGKEVLVGPLTGMPTPVVVSAWGKQLQLQSVTDPRLAQFVGVFDDGPQTPEIGTPCAQGETDTN